MYRIEPKLNIFAKKKLMNYKLILLLNSFVFIIELVIRAA